MLLIIISLLVPHFVSPRLHLIDFEQLKIENQTMNEKIEERNEELLKLRKKNTTTVQVWGAWTGVEYIIGPDVQRRGIGFDMDMIQAKACLAKTLPALLFKD